MDGEQARPLYAFFVVSLVAGLLLGSGIRDDTLLDVFTGTPAGRPVASIGAEVTLTPASPERPVLAPPRPGVAPVTVVSAAPLRAATAAPGRTTTPTARPARASRPSGAGPASAAGATTGRAKSTVRSKPGQGNRVTTVTRSGRTSSATVTETDRGKATRGGAAARGKR